MTEHYSKVTHQIRVGVRPLFLADQSKPKEGQFVWAYHITIENGGREPVQLLRRSWHIVDAQGRTVHVNGEGVLGEQPTLEAGESFEYTSGTPLQTASGFMWGTYQMVGKTSGEVFDVEIPIFSLDSPYQDARLH